MYSVSPTRAAPQHLNDLPCPCPPHRVHARQSLETRLATSRAACAPHSDEREPRPTGAPRAGTDTTSTHADFEGHQSTVDRTHVVVSAHGSPTREFLQYTMHVENTTVKRGRDRARTDGHEGQ